MKQIRLRAMEPEDLDLLYRIENDQSLWGMGVSNVPYSRFTLHDFIANSSGNIYADGQVRLIAETEDGVVVGMADVVNFDAKNRRAEVGMLIECQYRRQGYGEQALRQLADYALSVLHLHQLYAYVAADNQPSLALFGKVGFTPSAQLHDWLYDGRQYHPALLMQRIL